MAKKSERVITADCPECSHPIYFSSIPRQGKLLDCPMCSEKLEVISRQPLVLDYALDEYEEEEEGDFVAEYEDDVVDWDD